MAPSSPFYPSATKRFPPRTEKAKRHITVMPKLLALKPHASTSQNTEVRTSHHRESSTGAHTKVPRGPKTLPNSRT